MAQQIFVSSLSAPVMTSDSRDTQLGCLQSFPKKMALSQFFVSDSFSVSKKLTRRNKLVIFLIYTRK